MIEINAELLLGRKVRDANGEKVGRIEEFQVERRDNACLVEAYLLGTSAVIDRLSAWSLIRPIRGSLRGSAVAVYRVPWEEMDLSDPEHPKLRVPKSKLRHAK
ncbi:MAG TPA: PRC-barrel domain-containing protein [Gemmatimonadaceae bacterium]|nr:PRC-barrel domain-containing protein [Gemmatimonadaceae bacterium]